MHVLHLSAGNLYGGIERMLLTLGRRRDLCPAMQPHFALCFDGRIASQLRECGAAAHILGDVRFSRPWTVRSARRKLADLLNQMPVDLAICHSCWPHALFAPVLRRAGIPVVFWAHDIPQGTHWTERLARRTPPDLVLANSRFTAAHVPKLFPGVRCEVQYPPVEPPPPMDRAAVRKQIRAELNTPEDAVVIVIASRFERWKGHVLLLSALAMLPIELNWFCWIVGAPQRPQERACLRELIAQAQRLNIAPRIRFLGHRDDIARVFAAAALYCQPNTTPEPFGVVFVEALASGLPVLTSNLGSAADIVNVNCGRLVKAGDPQSLAEELKLPLSSSAFRATLSDAATRRARDLFDLTRSLAGLHNYLLECSGALSALVLGEINVQ